MKNLKKLIPHVKTSFFTNCNREEIDSKLQEEKIKKLVLEEKKQALLDKCKELEINASDRENKTALATKIVEAQTEGNQLCQE